MARIDLHLHTTYSDGSHSPESVVQFAVEAGVTAIAITDHDTVDGLPEAFQAGARLGISVLAGIEISAQVAGVETHILGYEFDWTCHALKNQLHRQREARHSRNRRMVAELVKLGMPLTYEDVQLAAGSDSVGRPHIAKALLEKGMVSSIKDAFDRFLGKGKPAFIPRDLPPTADVISWIRDAGGVAALAHPAWGAQRSAGVQKYCEGLKSEGLQGLEVFHSSHNSRHIHTYLEVARRLELLVTGGSDFHGLSTPDIHVGRGRGQLKVPGTLLEPLRAAARRAREQIS